MERAATGSLSNSECAQHPAKYASHDCTRSIFNDSKEENPFDPNESFGRTIAPNLQGTGMVGVPGIASRIFSSVRDAGINVIMISQASSEQSICFAVKGQDGKEAQRVLTERCVGCGGGGWWATRNIAYGQGAGATPVPAKGP